MFSLRATGCSSLSQGSIRPLEQLIDQLSSLMQKSEAKVDISPVCGAFYSLPSRVRTHRVFAFDSVKDRGKKAEYFAW